MAVLLFAVAFAYVAWTTEPGKRWIINSDLFGAVLAANHSHWEGIQKNLATSSGHLYYLRAASEMSSAMEKFDSSDEPEFVKSVVGAYAYGWEGYFSSMQQQAESKYGPFTLLATNRCSIKDFDAERILSLQSLHILSLLDEMKKQDSASETAQEIALLRFQIVLIKDAKAYGATDAELACKSGKLVQGSRFSASR